MVDYEFDLMDPPFFDLEEILRWIEFTCKYPTPNPANGHQCLPVSSFSTRSSRGGILQAYGSIDTSPVQRVDQWTWTEFEILPAFPDGRIIHKKIETDVFDYVVRSLKAYRAAALKGPKPTLSQTGARLSRARTGLLPCYGSRGFS